MGGRFDATNVVRPLACAITPVALDHTQWLGRTLDEIARQKAGILRTGVPAVISRQDPAALEVIRSEAARVGAPLVMTADCEVKPAGWVATGTGDRRPARFADPPIVSLATPSGGRYSDLTLSLRGGHQVENATVAVLLAERLAAAGVTGLDARAIATGARTAVWPGRIEIVPGRPDLLLDGAHNPAGCAALAEYLMEHQAGRRTVLLFAAMKDKPAGAMLDLLCPLACKVLVAGLSVSRGESPDTLHRMAATRHPDVDRPASIDDALRLARAAAGPDGLVVVSGSLYLVGEVKKSIR